MAVTSDDDVQDGDTTAAGIAPATSAADEEDRTVQQPPDSQRLDAAKRGVSAQPQARPPPRGQVAVPAAKPGTSPMNVTSPPMNVTSPPMNVTSKRMTVVGLAPPAIASAPGASPSPMQMQTQERSPPSSRTPALPKKAPVSAAPRPGAGPASANKPVSKPGASGVGSSAGSSPTEAEEEDASITATAPAPRVPPGTISPISKAPIPLAGVPSSVQIREMPPPNDAPPKIGAALEEADETEVRTVVSAPPDGKPPPVPAETLRADDEEEEELEDSVTTQAPSAIVGGRLPEEDEPKTSPPLRSPQPQALRSPQPTPAAGRSPFDEPPIRSGAGAPEPPPPSEDDEDAYSVEDSVTTRGPAIPDFRLDDNSVTADAPVADLPPESSGRWPSPAQTQPSPVQTQRGGPALPPAIEDGTEGTTNRFPKRPAPRPAAGSSPAAFAATMQSPAASPLRVVAPSALSSPPVLAGAGSNNVDMIGADDIDDDEGNGTAVMVGAPVLPSGPSGASRSARAALVGGAAGARAHATALSPGVREPSSDSGLRVATHEQQHHQPPPPPPTGERASLGAMMAGALAQQHGVATDRGSGVAPREYPSQPLLPLGPQHLQQHYPQSEPSMALGATIPANHGMMPGGHAVMHGGQMQQYDFAGSIKKPRYGLLVGLVALLSFAIPLVLFLLLNQNTVDPFVRMPAEVGSDRVSPDTHKNPRAPPPTPTPRKRR
ncbi:MAG: hypothetical protein KIT84_27980 [Labilithrix sp.]|nr:hypothetical protein [Labilithrix sp.]MCW5814898.1 hypothetical protein [Labilithrix sp.]